MNIGFTGTRKGMTPAQHYEVDRIVKMLKQLKRPRPCLAVHGDAIGADAQFDGIAMSFNIARVIYPSDREDQRAHCEMRGARLGADPAPPLERNSRIVQLAHTMIATPETAEEQQRSGTWSTIRKARRGSRPLFVVAPDGTCRWPDLGHLRRELMR